MADISNKKVRKEIFDKYDGRCAYCGIDLQPRFTIDHIMPLRRGERLVDRKGLNDITNFNPACHSCNASKNTFSIEQWRLQLEKQYKRCIRDSATFRSLLRFGIVEKINDAVFFHFETL